MRSSENILFNRAGTVNKECEYVLEAIKSGHLAGDGVFTKKCSELLEDTLNVPKALLTTSCTAALELSALLLNLQPGDEVILPSFTFVSTVNAYLLRGVKPIFCDIRPDTLNIDETKINSLVTSKTKVIVPVHYAGVGCDMDVILSIARQNNLAVVEDNAHGLFGKYRGRNLGTFGCMSAQSFHETKNFTCGEGGAILINDPALIDRSEILREKGTNRTRFFRGLVDKYTWVDIGSSFLPSDLLAAFLFGQLEAREKIQIIRLKLWNRYKLGLTDWAIEQGVNLPFVPKDCDQAYHMFYMLKPSLEYRQGLILHLKNSGIQAVFHYLPLHLSDMGKKYGGCKGDYPVTERVSDRLLRLPFYNTLTESEQDRVINAVQTYKNKTW